MKRSHLIIVLVILAAIFFWPSAQWYWLRINDGTDDRWGFLALIAGLYFIWRDRRSFSITTAGIGIAIAILSVYTLAYSALPPLIRAAAAVLCLSAVTSSLWRSPSISALMAISLPVVASLQFYLGYPMRLVAAKFTETILGLAQLPISRNGTNLLYQDQVVGVDPACSGIEMLWVGLFFTFSAGAYFRWNLYRTGIASIVSLITIVFTNSIRVTLLFFKESGIVDLPEWTHEGVGITIFLLTLWFYQRWLSPEPTPPKVYTSRPSRPLAMALLAILLLPAIAVSMVPSKDKQATLSNSFPGWPTTYNNHYLEPVSPTQQELRFAKSFPGKMQTFSAGNEHLIIRWVDSPTRKLHSSAVCLRAGGYQIINERPGRFLAFASDGTSGWAVEEEIYSDQNPENKHPEVASWYWEAALGKSQGPWWAITRIRPMAF